MSSEPSDSGNRRYSRIGKYEVLCHVATGGIAAVYKARDVNLGREVALKILPPEVSSKPAMLERFRREARHVARLRHENIVTIYEFGEACGNYFLALEFIDGIDLEQYIKEQGSLSVEESLIFLSQTARALEHLHKFSMVHRDIKPSNLLIAHKEGRPVIKLTDLGLARVTHDKEFRVTRAGFTVGTVDYMSPEQARDSGNADIRSDIYSLGCTWYHMLSGQPPFADGSLAERVYKHFSSPAPDIRQFNPRISAALASILTKMMAKKPAERYQTPSDLLRDLERLKSPESENPQASVARDTGLSTQHSALGTRPGGRDTAHDMQSADDASATLPLASSEQLRAAAGQFERAGQVIAVGNLEYGIHLLLSCCKLDPTNLSYRRALRRASRTLHKDDSAKARSGTNAAGRTKLKVAKNAANYLQVLEHGEDLLAKSPWDIPTQMDMAEAAEALGQLDLAVWILEQAWQKEAPDITVSRALARLYESRGNYSQAILLWELVRKADPADMEASRKARDLAATETLARGQFEDLRRRRNRD